MQGPGSPAPGRATSAIGPVPGRERRSDPHRETHEHQLAVRHNAHGEQRHE